MPRTQPPGKLRETPRYSLITPGAAGAGGAAAAGTAPLAPPLRVEALGTALAPRPRVAFEAGALPRRAVAFGRAGTPHGAAVAQVSCKGKERLKPACWGHGTKQEPERGQRHCQHGCPPFAYPRVEISSP